VAELRRCCRNAGPKAETESDSNVCLNVTFYFPHVNRIPGKTTTTSRHARETGWPAPLDPRATDLAAVARSAPDSEKERAADHYGSNHRNDIRRKGGRERMTQAPDLYGTEVHSEHVEGRFGGPLQRRHEVADVAVRSDRRIIDDRGHHAVG